MNFKTTTLDKLLECKEQALPEFPKLMFGTIPNNGPLVFDSTFYYAANNIDEIDYKTFQNINKRYIQALIDNTSTKVGELFYLNKDGHILMNHQLVFLFLSFAQPVLMAYFNGILGELMANGIAFSDSFVLSLASTRVPTDLLQQIINEREHASAS